MSHKIRVMLIDDEMPVRDAYSRWLENDGRAQVIAESEDQLDALSRLRSLVALDRQPDVIALDVGLPETAGRQICLKGGISLIPQFKQISPDSRILVVTQGTEEDPILEAISAGADGYVWKNDTGDAIATAIQKVYDGKLVVTVSVAEKILGKLRDLGGREHAILPHKKRHKKLSEILFRTMKLYCYDGLSAKEIAERECISLDGVNSRIKKAKEIIGASTRREAFRIMSELHEDTT